MLPVRKLKEYKNSMGFRYNKSGIRKRKVKIRHLDLYRGIIPYKITNIVPYNLGVTLEQLKKLLNNLMHKHMFKDYQIEGMIWMIKLLFFHKRKGCILADEMGLGKTAEIIGLITLLKECRDIVKLDKIIIVAPKGLVNNWLSEIKHFTLPISLSRNNNMFRPFKTVQYYVSKTDALTSNHERGGYVNPLLKKA